MGRAEPDILVIVPQEGRWIRRGDELHFYLFGENGPELSFTWKEGKRRKAIVKALELEILRQRRKMR